MPSHIRSPVQSGVARPRQSHGPAHRRRGMNSENTESALTFGDLLKRYRVAAGLTQEALAERARVSPRTISDLERGVTSWPYRDTVALLAAALELTADERASLQAARRRPLGRLASRSPDDRAPALASGNATASAVGPVVPPSHLRTFLIAEIAGYTRFTHDRRDAAA